VSIHALQIIRIIKSLMRGCHRINAFAGAGVYREEPPVPGSPLIAAGLSATLAESQKWSYELHCINVEPDKQSFLKLRDATTAYRPPTVRNMHGSFDEKLPEILQLIELHPSLFFLDPFGY